MYIKIKIIKKTYLPLKHKTLADQITLKIIFPKEQFTEIHIKKHTTMGGNFGVICQREKKG